jgi:hypothetical protein
VLGQLHHRVGQQLERPAGPAGGRARAGGRHQQRFLLARQFAHGPGTRLLAQRRFQIAEHEATFGPVHRRATDRDAGCDLRVADARIGCEQDLRPLQLACRMPTTAQQPLQLLALALAQLDSVA